MGVRCLGPRTRRPAFPAPLHTSELATTAIIIIVIHHQQQHQQRQIIVVLLVVVVLFGRGAGGGGGGGGGGGSASEKRLRAFIEIRQWGMLKAGRAAGVLNGTGKLGVRKNTLGSEGKSLSFKFRVWPFRCGVPLRFLLQIAPTPQ